jgi:hypothetical protein
MFDLKVPQRRRAEEIHELLAGARPAEASILLFGQHDDGAAAVHRDMFVVPRFAPCE